MSINVNDKNLGHATAYAYYKAGGGTMTEAEFTEFMADFGTASQTAVEAAQAALASKNAAQTAATTATNKATEATTAATTATNKAAEAQADADAAALDASQAMSAASTATTKATEATTAAATATSAATTATTAKDDAVSAKTAAQTAQTGAETAAASVSASAAQIQTNADDISELKEDFATMESDGVVPSAEQIISDKGITDSVPYHYRRTGGNGADRLYDQIVGGTVCFNQLCNDASVIVQSGRKYLSKIGTAWAVGTSTGTAITGLTSGVDMIIDLTQMFGSAVADYIYSLEQTTAGAGVAFFKSLFPNDYYEYNSGELVSVSGLSEHKTVGFNQWDEEWEVGGLSTSTGANTSETDRIRSKNYIHVFPNTNYYFKDPTSNNNLRIVIYDSDKNFVSATNWLGNTAVGTGSNGHYVRFFTASAYGNVYKNDICINLSNPAKNGTYEPYKAHSYSLDSDVTLRGIPKLDANNNLYYDGDEYASDGTVARNFANKVFVGAAIGEYWTLQSINEHDIANFGIDLRPDKYITGVSPENIIRSNWYGDKVQTTLIANVSEEGILFASGDTFYVRISKSKASTVDEFKAYLAEHPLEIVYKLATPTTESADPYQHLQQCDPDGTEEYVSTGIVPIGHNSFYPENLRAKVEQLPWNFANLIAPTEATFTATRNYTTGALFIVNNVLYKATSNIANGGTITPNTNCTATTLAEIISALA